MAWNKASSVQFRNPQAGGAISVRRNRRSAPALAIALVSVVTALTACAPSAETGDPSTNSPDVGPVDADAGAFPDAADDAQGGVDLGNCREVVNRNDLEAGHIEALKQSWNALGCTGPVCDCPPPPSGPRCFNRSCETVP